MLKVAALSVLFILAPLPAAARTVAFYLDGALVEQQESARNGQIEFSLPSGALPESFRIKPGNGVTIVSVRTAPQKPAKNAARELAALADREGVLQDRLKALSDREEIFKSAAKSQSAKTLRRSRTNPEPLTAVRQGTDYALAQLESVYQTKRKTEKELVLLAGRRAGIQKAEAGAGTLVKVRLTPLKARVIASWTQADRFWSPSYQLRVAESGKAFLVLHANGVSLDKGETATVHLSGVKAADSFGYGYRGEAIPLHQFPVEIVKVQGGTLQIPITILIANTSGTDLPQGETACFQNGVYMGKGMFQGADAGKSTEILCNSK